MKRNVISGVLAAVLSISLSVPAMAVDNAAPEAKQSQTSSSAENKVAPHSVLYYGKVAEIGKDEKGDDQPSGDGVRSIWRLCYDDIQGCGMD